MAELGVVLRPAAVLGRDEAQRIVAGLTLNEVAIGGEGIINPGLWQRFDRSWNGPGGSRGTSKAVGTIGCEHGSPTRYDITLYRVTITEHGLTGGWTVESLCNDALQHAGLTLERCAKAALTAPPVVDPFKQGDL